MDLLFAYLTKDKSIRGAPFNEKLVQHSLCDLLESPILSGTKEDYQNENECLFTAFNQLSCSAFSKLMERNCQLQEENHTLRQENEKAKLMCNKMSKDLANAKENNIKLQQENIKCKTCQLNQGELQQYEQKYQNLEMQLKKCALIINSSLDGGAKVLGRVKDILTQSVVDDSNLDSEESKTLNLPEQIQEPPQKSFSRSKYFSSTKPIPSSDEDDDATILAPPSPEGCDMETQHFGGPGDDFVVCVPETVPFDYQPPQGVGTKKFFQSRSNALSPIIRKKSPLKLNVKKSVSPLKKLFVSPVKRVKDEPLESLDASIYSPPILEDFVLQPMIQKTRGKLAKEIGSTKQTNMERTRTAENLHENTDPQKKSLNNGQRTLIEQQTPKSQKSKALKQTKLTLNRLVNDGTSERSTTATKRMSTKTVRISPPAKTESKRVRRGKDPEDWPCKECYRLFREAEAAKKIDVRKMPVAMNFCPEHFNRYSYYLNTPPSFWDCGIGKAPRNGHLHPLDASAACDDDDFVDE